MSVFGSENYNIRFLGRIDTLQVFPCVMLRIRTEGAHTGDVKLEAVPKEELLVNINKWTTPNFFLATSLTVPKCHKWDFAVAEKNYFHDCGLTEKTINICEEQHVWERGMLLDPASKPRVILQLDNMVMRRASVKGYHLRPL